MPRYSNVRPDFQAPGPRVLIEKTIKIDEQDSDDESDEEEDGNADMSIQSYQKLRYYESLKVLGKLYRAIDEHHFFEELKQNADLSGAKVGRTKQLADAVWDYISDKTALIQWKHYEDFAQDVKDT